MSLANDFEAGLFSRVTDGTLKNFGIVNAIVTQTCTVARDDGSVGTHAGVIAGEIHNSTVTNVFSAGRPLRSQPIFS